MYKERTVRILTTICCLLTSNFVWSNQVEQFSGTSIGIGIGYISGSGFSDREVMYEKIDGLAIFEGDIILGTVAELEASKPNTALPIGFKGFVVKNTGYRWPGNLVT